MLNTRISLPASAVLSALLGMLAFDFERGAGALLVHLAGWVVRGVLVAWLTQMVLRVRNHIAAAAAFGAPPGAVLALAARLGNPAEPVWLGIGTGIVVAALVQSLSAIETRDVLPATLLSLCFFLIISSFWVAKSIKKGLLVGLYKTSDFELLGRTLSGAGAEQLAKVLNMVLAIAAMTAFTWLSRRLTRERLVVPLALGFTVLFLLFAAALGRPQPSSVWAFYLFGDLFNTVMVTAFFVLLHDSVVPEQAKRIYPFIVFGGVLGGVIGSTTVRSLQKSLGERPLLVVCALASAAIAMLVLASARRLRPPSTTVGGPATEPQAPPPAGGSPLLEGGRLVLRSRYLLGIVALVAVYEFCSATLDYQWTVTQVERLADEAAIKHHTATVYTITNWAAMLVQLLLAGTILRRFGVGTALLVLPFTLLATSSAFFLIPTLITAAALSVGENSLNYSLNQSAREALWVACSREEKYRAKAFADMFVQRAAKVVAIVLALLFDALGPSWARWLTLPVVVLVGCWILIARYIGAEFERRARASGGGEAAAGITLAKA